MTNDHVLQVEKRITVSPFPINATRLMRGFYVSINDKLIESLSENDVKAIREKCTDSSYRIGIGFYDGNLSKENFDPGRVIDADSVAVSFCKGDQINIPWKTDIVQRLFPFSSAISILGEKVKLSDEYCEYVGVFPIPATSANSGGWLFYPYKTIVPDVSTDEGKLAEILIRYGQGPHQSTNKSDRNEQRSKTSKRNHAIRLTDSIGWMDAKDYTGDISRWQNCVYTLASEPDENGICKVYIGEASNPLSTVKTRISQFVIDGKVYIDHSREEAQEHRFTRFRIDKLSDESGEFLHDMQDAMIGISYMLCRECPHGYIMTNKAQGKSFNAAIQDDKYRNNR